MRLRKGNKVEIRGNADGLTVEWRCARIISGDGHTYSVQYDCSSTTSGASTERVSRKAIRPCPPLIKGIESQAANDHVEVYNAGSWRVATVLKVIGGDFYLVRLWVSCKELKVRKVNMRPRQSWQNGQWVVVPKGSGKSSWCLISNSYKDQPENQCRNIFSPGLDASGLQESRLASSSTLKRMSPYSSVIEAYPRKLRAVENMGECERFKAVTTAPLLQKESDTLAGPCQEEDTLYSDAESLDVGDVDKGGSTSPKEVVAEIIHRLELHAYHSTLEVLYASGPLSWEHEELLTNLRISLHISNDEHLMEIKNLVSSGQNF
ncbi:uncharacterized protein LOC114408985 isoform X3 [Glycine soja]|uniref:uncharacterized protein isoform X2 n=1 Tax=Glycine max TaxID=3847 RepID=UPI0007191142|nr:uncharacterized protein LOC100812171 isoform X2 [Glycine max]XP_028228041.1 uncharacterized protein LOC114408985 isoform X3 [Glycine soja]|eukprot:XP_014629998.1 uncharacterized protein LOC100812171 isoform X3 [Glycine max]